MAIIDLDIFLLMSVMAILQWNVMFGSTSISFVSLIYK